MSIRQAARRVGICLAVASAVWAFLLTTLSSPASAADPAQGQSGPDVVPESPFTAGMPLASGQGINVVVPANDLLDQTTAVNILECAAPNGVLPTLPDECDGNTIQGPSVFPDEDGSINFQQATGTLYPVYALPDFVSLNEGAGSAVTCGDTAATECVLYIGDDQSDFTQPHVFSQPFNVLADKGDLGTNPGDGSLGIPGTGTPEVPLALTLPVVALVLLGGTVMVRRRRALSDSVHSA